MKTKDRINTTIIVLITTMLLIGGVLQAQQGPPQQGPPQVPNTKQVLKMVDELSQELELTTEVESKISDLYVAHYKAMEEKTKAGRPKREEMEALKTKFEKQVKSLLSKKQQKKFIALQKKNASKRGKQQRPNR